MIIAFDKPHPLGSICRYPCRHCGDREGASSELTNGHGSVDVRSVAMLIRARGISAGLEGFLRFDGCHS